MDIVSLIILLLLLFIVITSFIYFATLIHYINKLMLDQANLHREHGSLISALHSVVCSDISNLDKYKKN